MILSSVLLAAFLLLAPLSCRCTSIHDLPPEMLNIILTSYRSSDIKENSLIATLLTCKRWRAVVTEYIESLNDATSVGDERVAEQLQGFRIRTNWNKAAYKGFPSSHGSKFLTVTKNGGVLANIWSVDYLNGDLRDRAFKHIQSQWLVPQSWMKMLKYIAITLAYYSASYTIGARSSLLFRLSIPSFFCKAVWLKHFSSKSDEASTIFSKPRISHIVDSYKKHEIDPHHRFSFVEFLLLYQMPMNVTMGVLDFFNGFYMGFFFEKAIS